MIKCNIKVFDRVNRGELCETVVVFNFEADNYPEILKTNCSREVLKDNYCKSHTNWVKIY